MNLIDGLFAYITSILVILIIAIVIAVKLYLES